MNAKAAKQIPLFLILQRLGHQPAKEVRGEMWYKSPLRNETSPSFKINPEKNVWFDFGHGEGGNVLDFIMVYYNIGDVSQALRQLDQLIDGSNWSINDRQSQRQVASPTAEDSLPPVSDCLRPLVQPALIRYLNKRGIDKQTACCYVKEIHYTRHGKPYFALAFPNDGGGYELRNAYFKGVIGPKEISLLVKEKKRAETVVPTRVNGVTVFEGFIDFLSALTFYHVTTPTYPVIVLNGVSLKQKAVEVINQMAAQKVYLYLDRDDAGRRLAAHFQERLPKEITLVDKSDVYKGYKDFNQFLVQSRTTDLSR